MIKILNESLLAMPILKANLASICISNPFQLDYQFNLCALHTQHALKPLRSPLFHRVRFTPLTLRIKHHNRSLIQNSLYNYYWIKIEMQTSFHRDVGGMARLFKIWSVLANSLDCPKSFCKQSGFSFTFSKLRKQN